MKKEQLKSDISEIKIVQTIKTLALKKATFWSKLASLFI